MKKTIRILRRKSREDKPYYEAFPFETEDEGATVATALMQISRTSDLTWEHSCLQKKCGACAMVIDGMPKLACDTRLSECRGETVVVEPLRKFPVVRDLLVDRSAVTERLDALRVYPDAKRLTDAHIDEESCGHAEGLDAKTAPGQTEHSDAKVVSGQTERSDAKVASGQTERSDTKTVRQIRREERRDETAYEASKCIQCGLCLEVCPNYYREGTFAGMAGMAPMARLLAGDDSKHLRKAYQKSVYEGCGKSLACRDVCPAGLDMDRLLSRNNRKAIFGF